MGTQLLYCPEDLNFIVADIVFVHGLRGDPIATWSDGEVCWPRDFLREDVPNTRIMTWGYDSNIANITEFSSANSIFGHAENLLFDISRRRRSLFEKSRSIIFVGHSLGGLVIKEALIRSSEYLNNQQDYNLGSIFKFTSGVIFYGTPHRGSEKTGLGQIVAKIAALTLRQPNDKLLKNLEKDSDVLERQRRSFASISKNLSVVCLWEEKPMSIGIIVPEWSASIDGFNVRTNSIPADHSDMCKYKDTNSPGYQRTSGYIMNFVDHAVVEITSVDPQLEKEEKLCCKLAVQSVLQSLRFQTMEDRHDQIEEKHKQTFEWVFRGGAFVEWLEQGNDIFWISGKAGAGKSTFMKFIFNDTRTRHHINKELSAGLLVSAGFFFHERGTALQKSQTGFLKSVLYQIMRQCGELAATTCGERFSSAYAYYQMGSNRPAREDTMKAAIQNEWSRAELLRTLRNILQQTVLPLRIFLLVDGLDELDGDKDDLLELLHNVITSLGPESRLRLCISSRPWNIFREAFGNYPNFRLQDLTYRDIGLYVTESLNSTTRMRELFRIDPIRTSKLFDEIVQDADGVFLWVKLVVKSLISGLRNYDSIEDLRQRLKSFPKELEPLYKRMIDGIDELYIKEAVKVFCIMQAADKPLKTLSLWYAFGEEDGMHNNYKPGCLTFEDQLERCTEVDGRLRSRCAGLLGIQFTTNYSHEETLQYGSLQTETKFPKRRQELVQSTVQYLHKSVKDYFTKSQSAVLWKGLCSYDPHEWLQQAYMREIQDCLGSYKTFISGQEAGIVWEPLVDFMHHTRCLELMRGTPQTRQIIMVDGMLQQEGPPIAWRKFGLSKPPHWSAWSGGQWGAYPTNTTILWQTSLLTFAILAGLEKTVESTITEPGFKINEYRGRPLLHYAVRPKPLYPIENYSYEMAELLLEHGADPNIQYAHERGLCAFELILESLEEYRREPPTNKNYERFYEALKRLMLKWSRKNKVSLRGGPQR